MIIIKPLPSLISSYKNVNLVPYNVVNPMHIPDQKNGSATNHPPPQPQIEKIHLLLLKQINLHPLERFRMMAKSLLAQHKYQEVLQLAEGAEVAHEQHPIINYIAGRACYKIVGQWRLSPTENSHFLQRSLAHFTKAKTALELDPDIDLETKTETLNGLGKTFFKLKEFAKAFECFELVLGFAPNDFSALSFSGLHLLHKLAIPEALARLTKANQIQAGDSNVILGLSECYIKNREFQRAEEHLLQVDKEHQGTRYIGNLAEIYLHRDPSKTLGENNARIEKGLSLLWQHVEQRGDDFNSNRFAAILLIKNSLYLEASAYLRRCLELKPHELSFKCELVQVCLLAARHTNNIESTEGLVNEAFLHFKSITSIKDLHIQKIHLAFTAVAEFYFAEGIEARTAKREIKAIAFFKLSLTCYENAKKALTKCIENPRLSKKDTEHFQHKKKLALIAISRCALYSGNRERATWLLEGVESSCGENELSALTILKTQLAVSNGAIFKAQSILDGVSLEQLQTNKIGYLYNLSLVAALNKDFVQAAKFFIQMASLKIPTWHEARLAKYIMQNLADNTFGIHLHSILKNKYAHELVGSLITYLNKKEKISAEQLPMFPSINLSTTD